MTIYTLNPSIQQLRDYVEVARIVDNPRHTPAWRYVGCEHHIREFIAVSREAGDSAVYCLFRSGSVFCGPCWHLERQCSCRGDHTNDALWLSNQIPIAVLRP